MLKKPWLAALVVAVFSLSIYSCSDDDPAGPGNGGGGVTGSKIAAGVYDLELSQWTCGMTDTIRVTQEQVACVESTFDEFLEIDCPVVITNNSFTVDCTSTEDDGFCSYTERVQVSGTKVGDIWTITGTVTISNENPANCSGEPACANVMAVVELVSGAPSACAYAEANTIEATVVGGPFAGSTDFNTFGNGGGAAGVFAWNFFGEAGSFVIVGQEKAASVSNVANINVSLAEINASSLPATFSVSVVGTGVSSPSTLQSGSVGYFDQTTAGAYFFSTGGSGSITVNEVSDTHIAGTINSLSIDGQQIPAGGGTPTPATRSLSGGFHVRDAGFTTTAAPRNGWVGRFLSKP